jgi:hypothetical protein
MDAGLPVVVDYNRDAEGNVVHHKAGKKKGEPVNPDRRARNSARFPSNSRSKSGPGRNSGSCCHEAEKRDRSSSGTTSLAPAISSRQHVNLTLL